MLAPQELRRRGYHRDTILLSCVPSWFGPGVGADACASGDVVLVPQGRKEIPENLIKLSFFFLVDAKFTSATR